MPSRSPARGPTPSEGGRGPGGGAATAFGRYEVRGEIGDGTMGRVYQGFDPRFGRPVALKTIKSEYLTRETRDEYLRRFRREAPAAGRLSHPNIGPSTTSAMITW